MLSWASVSPSVDQGLDPPAQTISEIHRHLSCTSSPLLTVTQDSSALAPGITPFLQPPPDPGVSLLLTWEGLAGWSMNTGTVAGALGRAVARAGGGRVPGWMGCAVSLVCCDALEPGPHLQHNLSQPLLVCCLESDSDPAQHTGGRGCLAQRWRLGRLAGGGGEVYWGSRELWLRGWVGVAEGEVGDAGVKGTRQNG